MNKIARSDVPKVGYFISYDKPYDISYGHWTVKWWRWAKSIPNQVNPVIDETGKHAHVQQEGPVWYLAGTFGKNKIPHRTCEIPSEKAILFPVINYEMNPLERPELASKTDLISHVIQDIDDILIRYAIVDGIRIPVYRVRSEPLIFSIAINSEYSGETTYAVADGYWVFLKPLSKGKHHLYFHGSCEGGLRKAAADYKIVVI
ncbi:MAG: hypothetical protein M3P08_02730 [Thermoproteota archaeon]|nr:hypothetical protein [Thermoproteota archaeon]